MVHFLPKRLILTMIDYFRVVDEQFETSHLWNKSRLILLIYYVSAKLNIIWIIGLGMQNYLRLRNRMSR